MDKTKRMIVALLILAIVFSAMSIFISLAAFNLDIPRKGVSGQITDSGASGISIYVEAPPGREVEGVT